MYKNDRSDNRSSYPYPIYINVEVAWGRRVQLELATRRCSLSECVTEQWLAGIALLACGHCFCHFFCCRGHRDDATLKAPREVYRTAVSLGLAAAELRKCEQLPLLS